MVGRGGPLVWRKSNRACGEDRGHVSGGRVWNQQPSPEGHTKPPAPLLFWEEPWTDSLVSLAAQVISRSSLEDACCCFLVLLEGASTGEKNRGAKLSVHPPKLGQILKARHAPSLV